MVDAGWLAIVWQLSASCQAVTIVVLAAQYVHKLTNYPVTYQFDLHKLVVKPTWHK